MRSMNRGLLVVAGVSVGLIVGCGNNQNGGMGPGTMSISVGLSPASLTLAPGGNESTQVTVSRAGGFTGSVTISIEGAPAGITASTGSQQDAGTTTTATISVQANQSAAAGNYTLTIRAAGSGVSDATAELTLTITPPPFTLSVSPGSLSVQQGQDGTITVSVARTNFSEAVALSLEGAPAGLPSAFAPNPTTSNTSILTLSPDGSTPPGTYTLTVRGTATGVADQTVALTATVTTPPSANTFTVDWSTCSTDLKPVWVALRNGTGPWLPVTGNADVYTFAVDSGVAGVAVVLDDGFSSEVNVDYALSTEVPITTVIECPVPTLKTINATVAGLGAGDRATFNLGGGLGSVLANGPLTIQNTPLGSHDLVGYKRDPTAPGSTDRMIIRRDQDIPDGGSLGTIDFAGAEAFNPISATMTVTGLPVTDSVSATLLFNTSTSANSCNQNAMFADVLGQGVTNYTLYGPPPANVEVGDFYSVLFGFNTDTLVLSVFEDFATLSNRTIALPAQLPTPVTSLLAGPYKRVQAALTLPSEYDLLEFSYTSSTGPSRNVSITATPGSVGGTAMTLLVPDFSSMAGWDNSWAPAPTDPVDWEATASGGYAFLGVTGQQCVDGGRRVFAYRTGTF